MKKILGLFTIALVFAGCIKDEDNEVTNEAINAVRFSASSVGGSFPTQLYVPDLSADEEPISLDANRVKFEGYTTAPEDIPLEYKINPAALEKYNSDELAADPSFQKFELMPDSTYSINVASDIIKKGEVYAGNDSFNVVFYPQKINTAINYILPLTVTSLKYPTATGTGTLMYYLIGNPIAGAVEHEWIRWNNATGTGAPAFDETYDDLFTPVNPTTVSVESGTGTLYLFSFKNTSGVLSDFNVKFDPASVTSAGITITSGPTITLADPILNKYEFTFSYNNSSGSPRVIIDKFSK